ncbi:acyltransferase family protein [Exiguobacterium aurantiacum]|uniref:Acyltransferase n=1 Tax=Exiguobacterium aurantiacum TaxID=33987 RepID=A0ABY5FQ57_9BACL|nr:acyltransferase [Exiguobacterium aurantiacum]UTT43738.1 acyltransferase [Exiguobacterium aurantiacum]
MQKLTYLDALRGYAILGVILTHTIRKFHGDIPETLYQFGIQGSRGVQLFFIVSAFTLFYSLEKHSSSRQFSIPDFYIKRFFRIAPMFYFALLFYMVFDLVSDVLGIYSSYPEVSMHLILSTITFTNVLHPDWLFSLVPGGWSISNEFLFYLCIPFLFYWIRTPRTAYIFVAVSVVTSVALHSVLGGVSPFSEVKSYLFYWFPNQLSIFLMGITLFFVGKKYTFNLIAYQSFTALSILCILVLGLTPYDMSSLMPKHVLFGLAFCLLALGLSGAPNRILDNRPIQFIGTISFSIYLVHFFVLDMVNYVMLDTLTSSLIPLNALLIVFLTTLLVSILFAYITYRLIELPGIRLGRILIQKLGFNRTKRKAA